MLGLVQRGAQEVGGWIGAGAIDIVVSEIVAHFDPMKDVCDMSRMATERSIYAEIRMGARQGCAAQWDEV